MVATLLALLAMGPVLPTGLRLGADGEILGWLASGPFPNVGALQLHGTGFARDYLAGEPTVDPVEGQIIPMIPEERDTDPRLTNKRNAAWILGLGNAETGVDLDALLNGSKPAIAYLFTTLESPSDRDAVILFGSDDGAKLYVNGRQVFSKQIARGVKRDEERVPIHLNAGRNRILFKIEQGDGGWGLLARVADTSGKGMRDVTERLELLREGSERQPGSRWVRKCAGKSDWLDVEAAEKYDSLSVRAKQWVDRFRAEADHPESLNAALAAPADTGGDAEEVSLRLLQRAYSIENAFKKARAGLLAQTQRAEPLVRTDPRQEDYVKPMPGGRYFTHADGAPFIPIGYNHNPDWPEFEESNPDRPAYRPEQTERYIAHLAACGVNVLRLMIETPQSGNLEDPIGTFSPEHVRWIDTIVAAACKHGIKLIVTPWDTFWMNRRFDASTYNPLRGGPLKSKIDFVTDPKMRAIEKRRLKFMVDRWGNSGTIFSWELLNEADLWWGASAAQIKDWITDVAGYVRSYEKTKWGRNHMLSVSFSQAMPHGEMAEDAYDLPVLDYATTHLYIGASKAPTEPIGPALAIKEGVTYCLAHLHDDRPYMDTENGPIDKWIDDGNLDNHVFLGMIWAHLASGGAGSGFRWPYRHPHHLSEGMLDYLRVMSNFCGQVPWKDLTGAHLPITTEGESGEAVCAFGTRNCAIVWASGGSVTVHWPEGPSRVRVRSIDCQTGNWLPATEASGSLTLPKSSGPVAYLLTAD